MKKYIGQIGRKYNTTNYNGQKKKRFQKHNKSPHTMA